jgi:hypothetical protein
VVEAEEELALVANPQLPDHFDRFRHIYTYAPPSIQHGDRLRKNLHR